MQGGALERGLVALALAAALGLSPGCAHAPPAAGASATTLECQVWERERGFARSVAAHDAVDFAEHVHPEAIFVEGDGTFTRGRAAIVDSWRGIIAGEPVRLWWHPAAVVAGAGPGLAVSRGPFLVEDPRPGANQPLRIGTFQSLWARGADGVWRVFLDGGTPPPGPATAEQAARLKAVLEAPCPR